METTSIPSGPGNQGQVTPVGSLICLLRSRDLAAGFTLWGLMTWGLTLSLLASDRQRRTGE